MNEYYGIMYTSDSLSHHGVKGMHWGVRKMIDRRHKEHKAKRRYQNPDGSLKERGKAKIARSNGTYLNPSRKRKRHTKYRKEVSKQYVNEYNDRIRKAGKDPERDYLSMKEELALWNKYKNPYASATLRDFRMKDTKQARKDVNALYRRTDVTYDQVRAGKLAATDKIDNVARQKEQYRKEIAHPTRTKLKKAGKKAVKTAKSVLSTAATIKSLVK